MKKISFLLILLTLVILLLTGCTATVDKAGELKNPTAEAIILMPDGSIIKGTCTDRVKHTDGWQTVVIDGIKYRVDQWRLAIIEETK